MDARSLSGVGQRTYEEFQPRYDWAHERGVDTLIIDLSGFKKEHLKVKMDDYGKLHVSGERQLSGTRWSRFRKEFRIPDNCNASDIRAKFDNGVLYITMPKLISEQPDLKPQTTTESARTAPSTSQTQKANLPHREDSKGRPTSDAATEQPAATVEKPPPAVGKTPPSAVIAERKEESAEKEDKGKETSMEGKRHWVQSRGPKGAGRALAERLSFGSGRMGMRVGRPRKVLVMNLAAALLVLVGIWIYAVYWMRRESQVSHELVVQMSN